MEYKYGGKILKLPDFIIVGAMKSGTTSLHHLLSNHNAVFMPPREILFFDIDDIEQNLNFYLQVSPEWIFHDYEKHFDKYLAWYASFFENAGDNQIIGEDSTTYMASTVAPRRISDLLPAAKLIFMLRDPVARTYSHYWHLVHNGMAIYDFEKTLECMPGTLLQRSLYKQQIELFLRFFRRSSMKFIIFEDFVSQTQNTVDDVCSFLGIDKSIRTNIMNTHRNPSNVPRNAKLQILFNHLFRTKKLVTHDFGAHLPGIPKTRKNRISRKIHALCHRFSFSVQRSYPPMKPKTEKFLQHVMAKENRGLSEIIGIGLKQHWPYFKS